MRIISGIYKSRIIKSPSGKNEARPTTDRARETLFNILANRIDFKDKTCLDLFCGTGSFGLEFLSRGGIKCTFLDIDTSIIKENVHLLKLKENYEIIKDDAIRYLIENSRNKFDVAFADPPYAFKMYDRLFEAISGFNLLFILEHNKNFMIPIHQKEKLILQKKIGISFFSFFHF